MNVILKIKSNLQLMKIAIIGINIFYSTIFSNANKVFRIINFIEINSIMHFFS